MSLKEKMAQRRAAQEADPTQGVLNSQDAEAVTERICQLVAQGHHLETAALVVGLTKRTLHNWRTWGTKGDPPTRPEPFEPYISFVELLSAAEAVAEERITNAWLRQFDEDWRAAAAYLGRRFPDRWGKQREEGEPDKGVSSLTVVFSQRDGNSSERAPGEMLGDSGVISGAPEDAAAVPLSPADAYLAAVGDDEESSS